MKDRGRVRLKLGAAALAALLLVAWIAAPSGVAGPSSAAETGPAVSVLQPEGEPLKSQPRSSDSEETYLSEAEVVNMVKILRTALQKGDAVTRDSMIVGLRERPELAERVLGREIQSCREGKEKLRKGLEEALAEIEKK
jgi:hypothetical protein